MNTDKNTQFLSDMKECNETMKVAENLEASVLKKIYGYYRKADENTANGAVILAIIDDNYAIKKALDKNIPKTKLIPNKIAWTAGFNNKQRVSDCNKLMQGAKADNVEITDFDKWIEKNGGIKATLDHLRKTNQSNVKKEVDTIGIISKNGKLVAENLFAEANNIKQTTENPCGVGLNSEEYVLTVTRKTTTGSYEQTQVKLTFDDMLHFVKQNDKRSNYDQLVSEATLIENDNTKAAKIAA